VARVEGSAILGHPAQEIIALASGSGVSLVVVGARGHGAVKRLVLGSVSERVLHHAPCSVLVVKGRGARADS
jgi:nucleotide-binding universal stress UspA family protein